MSYHWNKCGYNLPSNAVFVGKDTNNDRIYVGRAQHNGDSLPVKIIPEKNSAFFSYGGKEMQTHNFEALCGTSIKWVPCFSGKVPAGAISTGRTKSGETLFIGRANFNGALAPGKIHPSHGCMYIPYGGKEHRVYEYEALLTK